METFEVLLLLLFACLVIAPFWVGFTSSDKRVFWNPLTVIAAVFAYYFLVGPLISLGLGVTARYDQEFRSVMWKPWLAGLVGLSSIYLGFSVPLLSFRRKYAVALNPGQYSRVKIFCIALFGAGFASCVYFAIVSGKPLFSYFTPWIADVEAVYREENLFAAGNYLVMMINAFIPAVALWYVYNRRSSAAVRWVLVGAAYLLVMFLFASLGFRHRIVTLTASLAATVYLLRNERPNPLKLFVGVLGLVMLAGVIGLTRTYGRGLDLSQVQGYGVLGVLIGGLNDSSIFFTLAMVMDFVPSSVPFFGFQSLIVAATIPVPRALWPGKPEPEYLAVINEYAGTQGQAIPMTGEHYMMAGWPGIIIGGLIVGIIYRGFWNFYRSNPENPIVTVIYAMSFGLCFPLLNRGYLAQELMEYFFDLMPVIVFFLLVRNGMKYPGGVQTPAHGGAPVRSFRRGASRRYDS